MNQLKSIYNIGFKDLNWHPIDTCFPIIVSHAVDLLDYISDFPCFVCNQIRRLRTTVQITVYEILFD